MDTLPHLTLVSLERRGPHLRVILDDPRTQNALSAAMVTDLEALLAFSAAEPGLRSLIFESAGGAFCAGADLKAALAELDRPVPGGMPDPLAALNRCGGEFYARLNAHPLVTIAVIDGAAFGGGFGIACCMDVVVCGPGARFALSETSLGLPPAQIAPYVTARLGLRTARRLALTGERFDGRTACDIGLADFYGATSDEVAERLRGLLDAVGRCAPHANAVTKKLLLDSVGQRPADMLDQAAEAFASCLRGPEGREGVAAFAGKRPPSWVETV